MKRGPVPIQLRYRRNFSTIKFIVITVDIASINFMFHDKYVASVEDLQHEHVHVCKCVLTLLSSALSSFPTSIKRVRSDRNLATSATVCSNRN